MKDTNFERMTLADILRMLFQRMRIILACFAVALVVSGVMAVARVRTLYTASLVLLAQQASREEPLSGNPVPDARAQSMAGELTGELCAGEGLRMLVRNLRLEAKNHEAAGVPSLTAEALRAKYGSQSPDALRLLSSRMELVSLARLLGIESAFAEDGVEKEPRLVISEQQDPLLRNIAVAVGLPSDTSYANVRARALAKVGEMFSDKGRLSQIPKRQIEELSREENAAEILKSSGLFGVCASEELLDEWAAYIARGLKIRHGGGNQLAFTMRAGTDGSRFQALDRIVAVAGKMAMVAYRAPEPDGNQEEARQLQRQRIQLERSLETVNRELSSKKALARLQEDYPGLNPESASALKRAVMTKASVHVKRLDELEREAQSVEDEAELRKSKIGVLKTWLADASREKVETIRLVHVPDSIRVRELCDTRRTLRRELALLLRDSTERHPGVQDLRQRIRLLDSAIAKAREPVKETITEENLRRMGWRIELEENTEAVALLEKRLNDLKMRIRDTRARAAEAPRFLREYLALLERKERLAASLEGVAEKLETLRASEQAMKAMSAINFSVHSPAARMAVADAPALREILVGGLLAGLLVAVCAVFLVESADHSIKSLMDARRHFDLPVLATISEFQSDEEGAGGWIVQLRERLARKQKEREIRRGRKTLVLRRKSRLRKAGILIAICAFMALAAHLLSKLDSIRALFQGSVQTRVEAEPDRQHPTGAAPKEVRPQEARDGGKKAEPEAENNAETGPAPVEKQK
jgi:capsular polysaccharide biosynthesis protein/gamma-glutamylcyclotransferase (GGCT)/AIG2-like uncharacterized protein YtfP